MALKTSVWPLHDVRVRRAVFRSMYPFRAIEDLWAGLAFVSAGFPLAGPDWSMTDDEFRRFFNRPERARELLREAEVPMPLPVSIKAGDFGERYVAHARRIADEMRAVGFDPFVEIVNRRAFGEEVWLGGDYQILVGPTAPVVAPNGYLLPVLHSRGRWNTTGHQDDEMDRLLEAQAQETDALTRKGLIEEIQLRMLDNAYRFMPATRITIWTWQPRVRDFHPNFAGFEYHHWASVWLRD